MGISWNKERSCKFNLVQTQQGRNFSPIGLNFVWITACHKLKEIASAVYSLPVESTSAKYWHSFYHPMCLPVFWTGILKYLFSIIICLHVICMKYIDVMCLHEYMSNLLDYFPLCSLAVATSDESRCWNFSVSQFEHRLSCVATCRRDHQHRRPVVREVELLIDVVLLFQTSPVMRHCK